MIIKSSNCYKSGCCDAAMRVNREFRNTDHVPLFVGGTTSKSTFQLFVFVRQHFTMLHLLLQFPLYLAFQSRQSRTLLFRFVQLSLQLLHLRRHLVRLFNDRPHHSNVSSTDICLTVFEKTII